MAHFASIVCEHFRLAYDCGENKKLTVMKSKNLDTKIEIIVQL